VRVLAPPGFGAATQGLAVLEMCRLRRAGIVAPATSTPLGSPVVLFPGFSMPQRSMDLLARWLCGLGYSPKPSDTAPTLGCSATLVARAESRVVATAEATGRPVALIGHSRGGQLARVVAARCPDLVSGVITLGTPGTRNGLDPTIMLAAHGLMLAGRFGVSAMPTADCFAGTGCCAEFTSHLKADRGPGPPIVSIWSPRDGIVPSRSLLRTGREALEIKTNATHVGMLANVGVFRAIARTLNRLDPGRVSGDAGVEWPQQAHASESSVVGGAEP
jgi:hypothetical protein